MRCTKGGRSWLLAFIEYTTEYLTFHWCFPLSICCLPYEIFVGLAPPFGLISSCRINLVQGFRIWWEQFISMVGLTSIMYLMCGWMLILSLLQSLPPFDLIGSMFRKPPFEQWLSGGVLQWWSQPDVCLCKYSLWQSWCIYCVVYIFEPLLLLKY